MFEPPRKEEFLDLFDVCVDGLFSRCHSRVPDRAEAIALVEETFMRGWNEVVKGNKVGLRELLGFLDELVAVYAPLSVQKPAMRSPVSYLGRARTGAAS